MRTQVYCLYNTVYNTIEQLNKILTSCDQLLLTDCGCAASRGLMLAIACGFLVTFFTAVRVWTGILLRNVPYHTMLNLPLYPCWRQRYCRSKFSLCPLISKKWGHPHPKFGIFVKYLSNLTRPISHNKFHVPTVIGQGSCNAKSHWRPAKCIWVWKH